MVNGDLNLNKLLEYFKKKNYEKQINNDLEQKMPLNENNTKYMSNRKDTIIYLIAGLIKKTLWKKNLLYKNDSILC